MQVEDCYLLGYIAKAHGLRGEVKAVYDVDYIEDYKDQESVYVLQHGKLVPFSIQKIQLLNHREAIIKFKDVRYRDQAEELVKGQLYLPLDSLPTLEGKAFYYHEVVDFSVQDEKLGTLGRVKEVREMPGNPILFMDYKGHEILIPVTDHIVLNVDRAEKVVHTHLPDGLLDVYLTDEKPDQGN